MKPCKHPGCANHVTHPCENCGQIWDDTMMYTEKCEKCKGTFPMGSLSLFIASSPGAPRKWICNTCRYGRKKIVIKCDYCGKAKCSCPFPERTLQRHNTSGYTGVRKKYKDGRNMPWVAEVTVRTMNPDGSVNRKRRSIGSFHTAEEAAKAREEYLNT